MAQQRKVFTFSNAHLPSEWLRAAETEPHIGQGHLVVLAESKATANAVLADRMLQGRADRLAESLRMRRQGQLSTDLQAIVDAGLISFTGPTPVVIAYYMAQRNRAIIAIDPDGTARIIGRFFYEGGPGGRGIYVHPGDEKQPER